MKISTHMLTLIDTAGEAVRQSLRTFVENSFAGKPVELGADLVSEVCAGLRDSLAEAGCAAFKAFVEGFDTPEERILRDGRTYFPKGGTASKKFLTIFGEVELERRYYHPGGRGAGIVPLDGRWGMVGRYATREVVESVLYLSSMIVPADVERSCTRLFHFLPSTACVQRTPWWAASASTRRRTASWTRRAAWKASCQCGWARPTAPACRRPGPPGSRGSSRPWREMVFFKRNRARMDYPKHVAQGWPIGSGPVEAACKTIVKARLCQSGMRWNNTGGRNILALRVIEKSDEWDST